MSSAKPIKDMTDEEVKENFSLYTTIEFNINFNKFIFRNVDIRDFSQYDYVGLIRFLVQKLKWYNICLFDRVWIGDKCYILTERTKGRAVLSGVSDRDYSFEENENKEDLEDGV